MRAIRALTIYRRLMTQHIKAILEYQADFWIAVGAAMITQCLGLLFLWVIYQRIPDIHGWLFWEVALIFALIFLTEGFSSLFFEGNWQLSRLVNGGELDRILLRPISPILQVIASATGINGIGNIVIGGAIVIKALTEIEIHWTFMNGLLAIVFLISGIAIRTSIYLAACSIVFWTHSPGNAFPNMIHHLSEFAKYPLTIYSYAIQVLVAVLIPYAFISFFPASYLFDPSGWRMIGLATPFVALYCVFMARWIFYRGLLRYESSGH